MSVDQLVLVSGLYRAERYEYVLVVPVHCVTRTRVVRRKMIRVLTLQNIQNNKKSRFLAPILLK